MSPVPHGHPKNDATACGKPAHVIHSTQDGQKNEKQNEKEPESVHLETREEQQKNLPVSDGQLFEKSWTKTFD